MKDLWVLKFGGETISNLNKINNITANIKKLLNQAEVEKLIVVVSAMGKETDNLIELAASIDGCGYYRELDHLICTGEMKAAALFTMSLLAKNINAVSINFNKLGIYTDSNHYNSKINKVDTKNIVNLLETNKVVVVAGFQGINELGDVSTLGRGGSDLSAIVLANNINAKKCILYKDVGAIFSDDPKINQEATIYYTLTYDELVNIVNSGSKVINYDALNYAKEQKVRIFIADPINFKINTTIGGA